MYVYSCNALPARFFAVDRALNSYFMIMIMIMKMSSKRKCISLDLDMKMAIIGDIEAGKKQSVIATSRGLAKTTMTTIYTSDITY